METLCLSQVKINTQYMVCGIKSTIPRMLKVRLEELGFVRGARIKLLHKTKLSGSAMVLIHGTMLGLDKNILAGIEVQYK